MNYNFDPKTSDLLSRHGWHAGRRADITRYKLAWKNDGYAPLLAAARFSENLGGLSIMHEAYRASGEQDRSELDPIGSMSKLDSRWVFETYEAIAKSRLCPVGLGYSGHMTYLVSETGGMYGAYDSFFCLIGPTIEEALHSIFFSHQFTVLSE